MNAFEIEQIEQRMNARTSLPLSYVAWSEIEHRARAERARMIGKAIATFFAVVSAKLSRFTGQVRRTAAECTDARLNHG
ncbi:MAG TPA: hypothetical protein VFS80_11495 [Burkholderiales bacterium]|nr:hypothetical protein [Burkholderiales bacterium]